MQARLEIRIPSQVKQDLDFLARITNQNISELIRDIIIPLTRIKTSLKAIETIEKSEKALTRAIIQLPEFQALLKELTKYRTSVELAKGYTSLEYEKIDMIVIGDNKTYYNVIQEGDKITVRKIEELEVCNQYGSCWTDSYVYRDLQSLSDLADFLETIADFLHNELEEKIEKVKEAIKRLIQ